jgi:hypothetical protein
MAIMKPVDILVCHQGSVAAFRPLTWLARLWLQGQRTVRAVAMAGQCPRSRARRDHPARGFSVMDWSGEIKKWKRLVPPAMWQALVEKGRNQPCTCIGRADLLCWRCVSLTEQEKELMNKQAQSDAQIPDDEEEWFSSG